MNDSELFNKKSLARICGLDTLRAMAILLVMIFHYKFFVSHENNFGLFSEIGWIGVDLFFVLSGYLISRQLFAEIKFDHFSFKIFYLKRALKILPCYYFVLFLYFLIPGFTESPIKLSFWKYALFIQNFDLPISGFSQSWSLCVEEHFYLIFPVIALLLRNNIRKLLIIMVAIVVSGLIIRGLVWQDLATSGRLDLYTKVIYYPSYFRLDGVICGIAIAVIECFYGSFYLRILRYANILLVFGFCSLLLLCIIVRDRTSFLTATIGYPLISVAFAIVLISSLSSNSVLNKYALPIMPQIAKWSFGVYLVQKPISVLLAKYFVQLGYDNNSYLIISLNLLTQLFAGAMLYYTVEYYGLYLREIILAKWRGERNGVVLLSSKK